MKKLFALFLMMTISLMVLTGCGDKNTDTPDKTNDAAHETSSDSGDKIVLRLAHAAGMEEPTHLTAVYIADELNKRSNGQIEVQVFPAGQLGDQIACIEGVMQGTIDISVNSAVTVSNWAPQLKILDLPYLISDTDEADSLFDGEVGQMMLDLLDDVNLIGLGWGENGFRQLYNNVRPINTVEDLKNLKIRSMETPISVQMFQSWGVDPTVIPWMETYTALQQGTVDGGDGPATVWAGSQMGTVVKYVSLTNHLYTAGLIVGSKVSFDKLPSETVQLIKEVGQDAGVYMRGLVRDMESEALESLEADGTVVNEVPAETRKQMAELASSVYDANRDEIGAEFFDEVMSKLGK